MLYYMTGMEHGISPEQPCVQNMVNTTNELARFDVARPSQLEGDAALPPPLPNTESNSTKAEVSFEDVKRCVGANAVSASNVAGAPAADGGQYRRQRKRTRRTPTQNIAPLHTETSEEADYLKDVALHVESTLARLDMSKAGRTFSVDVFIRRFRNNIVNNGGVFDAKTHDLAMLLLKKHKNVELLVEHLPKGDKDYIRYIASPEQKIQILQGAIESFKMRHPRMHLLSYVHQKLLGTERTELTESILIDALKSNDALVFEDSGIVYFDLDDRKRAYTIRLHDLLYDTLLELAYIRSFAPMPLTLVVGIFKKKCKQNGMGYGDHANRLTYNFLRHHRRITLLEDEGTELLQIHPTEDEAWDLARGIRLKDRATDAKRVKGAMHQELAADSDKPPAALSLFEEYIKHKDEAFRAHAFSIRDAVSGVIGEFSRDGLNSPTLTYLRSQVIKHVEIPEAFEEVFALCIKQYRQDGSEFLRIDSPNVAQPKGRIIDFDTMRTSLPKGPKVSDLNQSPRLGGARSNKKK